MSTRLRLLADLPRAVPLAQIAAVYQPQVSLPANRIVAVEALSRWNHPELGMISPADYIELAEATGDIHEVGRYMFEEAIACAQSWRESGIEVSVNVSAIELSHPLFFTRLAEDLERSQLAPQAITIEITETQPVLNMPSVVKRLQELIDIGLGVSIDDYGTGHSSMELLDRLPVTEVKIDQSLVRDTSRASTDLMTEVIRFAHDKNVRVVAEGVETTEQFERVRELDCDRAQGYLIGRPMSKPDVEALIFLSQNPS